MFLVFSWAKRLPLCRRAHERFPGITCPLQAATLWSPFERVQQFFKQNGVRAISKACYSPPTVLPIHLRAHPTTQPPETARQSGAKVYALLDKARVTIARQEALAAEEADLCERSDFLDSSR